MKRKNEIHCTDRMCGAEDCKTCNPLLKVYGSSRRVRSEYDDDDEVDKHEEPEE